MYLHSSNGKSLSVLLLFISITFSACEKDPFPIFKGGNSHLGKPVVLVAGYESNGTNNVAKYWIDGQEEILSNGTNNAQANAIFVSGSNVYIAGSDSGAVYWKNNQEIRLSGSSASSIFVSGNDIYVAGSDGPNAVYWKNGTEVPLDKNNLYGNYGDFSVNSIFVSGNDVYGAGHEGPNAVYWKNGKEIYFTKYADLIEGYVHANSIYVSGHEIYATGSSNIVGSFLGIWYGVNGAFDRFDNGQGNAVIVSGGDVYIAGMEMPEPRYNTNAAYWKNGNLTLLPSSETTSYANSIFVSGNHVYVAGYEVVNYLAGYAVYWKDGIETKLTDGTHLAYATSISIR